MAQISSSPMPEGEPTQPPVAFKVFCLHNPQECKLPSTEEVTGAVLEAQEQTRTLVIPQEEEGDTWETRSEPGPGDCEDFALTMRKILRGRFPEYSGAFLIATAYTEDNIYHAVLTIETDKGTIVCDIRYANCAPWEQFPYSWRLREVAGANFWQEIGPTRIQPQISTAASASGR